MQFCIKEEADILVKYYKNIAFLSFHDGRIMHRLRCSGIFFLYEAVPPPCDTQLPLHSKCITW